MARSHLTGADKVSQDILDLIATAAEDDRRRLDEAEKLIRWYTMLGSIPGQDADLVSHCEREREHWEKVRAEIVESYLR